MNRFTMAHMHAIAQLDTTIRIMYIQRRTGTHAHTETNSVADTYTLQSEWKSTMPGNYVELFDLFDSIVYTTSKREREKWTVCPSV